MKSLLKTVTLLSVVVLLNACATKSLLEKDSHYTRVSTTRKTLVQDNVVAFGKPVQKLQNISYIIESPRSIIFACYQSIKICIKK